MIEVFKAVMYCGSPGQWRSPVVGLDDGGVEYQLGVVSRPKAGMGPLSAFRTAERARRFICNRGHEMSDVVARCDAWLVDLDLRVVPDLSYSSSWGRLPAFWSEVNGASPCGTAWRMAFVPSGTIWCAWIRPIEVVP